MYYFGEVMGGGFCQLFFEQRLQKVFCGFYLEKIVVLGCILVINKGKQVRKKKKDVIVFVDY